MLWITLYCLIICSMYPKLHPLRLTVLKVIFLFLKTSTCLQLSNYQFVSYQYNFRDSTVFPHFTLFLSPSLQAGSFFCLYNIVKKPYGSPVYVMEAHINSSLCWDGQVDPHDTQISFSERLSIYTHGLLSRVYFLNSKAPSISIYCKFFKCSFFDSFSPNIFFFPPVSLSSCILL